MSKYQVIFYSGNSRYSYFVKDSNMNDVNDETYQAIDKAYYEKFHSSQLGIEIDTVNCRKVR